MPSRLVRTYNDHAEISERFDQFQLKVTLNLTSTEVRSHVENLIEALALIPSRDRFSLTLEICGDALEISSEPEKQRAIEHIESHHEDGDFVELRVEIIKSVELQRISIYSLEAFGAYLNSTPISESLAALAKRFQDRLVFDCQADEPGHGSKTLSFVKTGNSLSDTDVPLHWRNRSLQLLQDSGYRTIITERLLPEDFVTVQAVGVEPVDRFLSRAGSTISIIFLSNLSDLKNNKLEYRITGYKLLTGTIENLTDIADNSSSFLRVANWAYGEEGSSDKIGLARNVITLCVQHLEDLPNHPEIWDAIQSNYQIYLKENISTYLEVRNKLAELLAETTHKTHSLAEGLLDSIRNGVLITLTFLLSVVVINGLKDTGVQVIFSIEYLVIVIAVLALISIAIWASCRDACSRFDQSSGATSKLLKRMYAHVMINTEIEDQVNPTIKENREYLNLQMKKYQFFWWFFSIIVGLAFFFGYLAFSDVREPQTSSGKVVPSPSSPSAAKATEHKLAGSETNVDTPPTTKQLQDESNLATQTAKHQNNGSAEADTAPKKDLTPADIAISEESTSKTQGTTPSRPPSVDSK